MKRSVIILSAIVIILLVAGAGFWKWKGVKNAQIMQNNKEQQSNEIIDMSDWRTYKNGNYGFEVKYPENWEFDEYDGVSFFVKGFREVNRIGISDEAKKMVAGITGDYLVNISVYKDMKQYVGTAENWRRHDLSDIDRGSAREGRYFWNNFSFSDEKVLVFSEKQYSNENIGITRYYFFHNNDGYEISTYYSTADDGLTEKIITTLKFAE